MLFASLIGVLLLARTIAAKANHVVVGLARPPSCLFLPTVMSLCLPSSESQWE
jgi:hypothetical protein